MPRPAPLGECEPMEVKRPGVPIQAHGCRHLAWHHQGRENSWAPSLAYKCGMFPRVLEKDSQGQIFKKGRFPLSGRSKLPGAPPCSIAQGGQRLHRATVSRGWCPLSPPRV